METAKAAILLCLTVATGLGSWYLGVQVPDNQWRRPDQAGQRSMYQDRPGEAERLFATAVEVARTFGDRDPRLARSLFHQAQALEAQAKYTEAIPLLKESAAISETMPGLGHEDNAHILELYATALRKSGRDDEAKAISGRIRAR